VSRPTPSDVPEPAPVSDVTDRPPPDRPPAGRETSGPSGAGDGPPAAPLHAILDDPDAFEQRAKDLREWRPGFPDTGRPVASLLDALVWFFKLRADTFSMIALSTARRPMAEVKEEERRLIDEELERARAALPSFELGLRAARTAGDGEITFDSRDPDQDRIAGALIAYLVSTEFATVRTEDLPDDRYLYHLRVDWTALAAFARRLDLPDPACDAPPPAETPSPPII
jgi:hypothetical protein